MVVEYVRYRVASEQQRGFAVWATAQLGLQEATQCLGYEVSRGVEEPGNDAVGIEAIRHYAPTGIVSAS
jgi:hypothetical protein